MRTVSLGEVALVTTGQSAPQDDAAFSNHGTPFIRAGSLAGLVEGKTEDSFEKIQEDAAHKYKLKLYPKNSVIFAKSGMSAKLGRVHRLRKDCYIVSHLAAILPCKEIHAPYLEYWLKKNPPSRLIANESYPSIKTSVIQQISIALPLLEEQKRIAAILDKADAIRRKRQQAIELADQFLRSVFLDMFGDPVTNPKEWPKIKLGEMCIIVRGGSPRPIQEFLGGTIPWIKIGDATQDTDIYIESTKDKITEAGLTKTRLLKPGSLVFANCGVSLGFARILKIEGCIHDGWLAFDINTETLNQIFLLKALNQITDHFRRIAPDGTQPNLNTEIMKNFELIVPPQNLQVNFEQIVFKANASRRGLGLAYKKADEAFSSLTQSLFEGELRGQKVA